MSVPKVIKLDPDLDPWEQQPGESDAAHGQFRLYRDLGKIRTARQAAEMLLLNPDHVMRVSRAASWSIRAAAWDREQDRLFLEQMVMKRKDLVEKEARIATAVLAAGIERLRRLTPNDWDRVPPDKLVKILDAALVWLRDAYGIPGRSTVADAVNADMASAVPADDDDGLTDEETLAELARVHADNAGLLGAGS